ncbi:hypothetical protein Hanom_Chr07g00649841 [Helianthus anomalus]
MGRVYPIPNGYWAGYGISCKNFHGFGSGMISVHTRPDYPKPHTRLRELHTRSYIWFFNLYFYFSSTFCLLMIYFSIFIM